MPVIVMRTWTVRVFWPVPTMSVTSNSAGRQLSWLYPRSWPLSQTYMALFTASKWRVTLHVKLMGVRVYHSSHDVKLQPGQVWATMQGGHHLLPFQEGGMVKCLR